MMATILVVDDDADVRRSLEQMLADRGYDVLTAPSGTAALDILDRSAVDLLLTDIVMPGLNGFNLARMARRHRPSLKILYLTGYIERGVVERDAGDKYGKILVKPIAPDELGKEVGTALLACNAEPGR
jgi:CheY-like chemotaxis protein